MVTKQVEFINKTGLHARPASDFCHAGKKYESKITICKEGGEPVNAKSVVRLWQKESGREQKRNLQQKVRMRQKRSRLWQFWLPADLENKGDSDYGRETEVFTW